MCYLVLKHHVDDGVLHHFAEHFEPGQLCVLADGLHHGVARDAHTALYGEHSGRDVALADVAQEEVDNVVADGFGLGRERLERACLLRDAAFHHAHELLRVEFEILLAYASAHRDERDGLAVGIFGTFVFVMQVAHARVVECVELKNYAFGYPDDSRHDAVGRCQEYAHASAHLLDGRHLDDGPVDSAVESAAQTLCHVSQVHVLVVYLAHVGVTAEVGIGREWGAELDGLGVGEVALQTLARRCTGDDAHLERATGLMFAHGTLRQLAYHCLGHAVGRKSAEPYVVAVVYHCRPFGSRNLSVCHILIVRCMFIYI